MREPFATFVALVRFLPAVEALVFDQMVLVLKRLATFITVVWSLA